jgi:dCMP deaminase
MEISKYEKKWLIACQQLAPIFSTCGKKQYFAVVLAPNRRVAGIGYNGSPPGMVHCNEGGCPRMNNNSLSGSNYDNCISQHAEAGALLWSDQSMRQNGTLVVNGPPCMGCAKLIASSGIKRVVGILDNDYAQWKDVESFLTQAKVEVAMEQYENCI